MLAALAALRDTLEGIRYPLATASADDAVRTAADLTRRFDDYLLPRLARLDAPLLVVVGGSTGAGKSTLVNSLIQAPVSTAGVLRPTTRAPVLVCNPADLAWFQQPRLLPGLRRTSALSSDPGTLRLAAAPALRAGLALLDAPDIDSVVDANRELATQLLAAADLWLFVTTAARYADAVPWDVLRQARDRGTVVALVLDRTPPGAEPEIVAHLATMLRDAGLAPAPIFGVPETVLDHQGLLPESAVVGLRDWLSRLAGDAAARDLVVRHTVDGALAALEPAVAGLVTAADDQVTAVTTLSRAVDAAYRVALSTVEDAIADGSLLRGEVLARWQEFVGTGELMSALQARVGRARDRVAAAVTGRTAPGRPLRQALSTGLLALVEGAAADAAEQVAQSWRGHPAGAALLDGTDDRLDRPSRDLIERTERLTRDWQRGVLDLVRHQGADRRRLARVTAYTVNGSGLLVMLAVFSSTAFLPTGLEFLVAGGTSVAAQKLLEAVFGDQAMRALAEQARQDLLTRVRDLLDEEARRYRELLAAVPVQADAARRLRAAAAAVVSARAAAGLGVLR
ncbi:MAG TPA: ABC transporter [Micromonosporaceae bacterium]